MNLSGCSKLEKLLREEQALKQIAAVADIHHRVRIEEILSIVRREIAAEQRKSLTGGANEVVKRMLREGSE